MKLHVYLRFVGVRYIDCEKYWTFQNYFIFKKGKNRALSSEKPSTWSAFPMKFRKFVKNLLITVGVMTTISSSLIPIIQIIKTNSHAFTELIVYTRAPASQSFNILIKLTKHVLIIFADIFCRRRHKNFHKNDHNYAKHYGNTILHNHWNLQQNKLSLIIQLIN